MATSRFIHRDSLEQKFGFDSQEKYHRMEARRFDNGRFRRSRLLVWFFTLQKCVDGTYVSAAFSVVFDRVITVEIFHGGYRVI